MNVTNVREDRGVAELNQLEHDVDIATYADYVLPLHNGKNRDYFKAMYYEVKKVGGLNSYKIIHTRPAEDRISVIKIIDCIY